MSTSNNTATDNRYGNLRVSIKSHLHFLHLVNQFGWSLVLFFLIPAILDAVIASERKPRDTHEHGLNLIKRQEQCINRTATGSNDNEEKPRLDEREVRLNCLNKTCTEFVTSAYRAELENERLKVEILDLKELKKEHEELKRNLIILRTKISFYHERYQVLKDEMKQCDAMYHISGNTRLHVAAYMKNEQLMNETILLGAKINARNDNSETPLIVASKVRDHGEVSLKIVKDLIYYGADLDAIDVSGQTFLHKLVSNGTKLTASEFREITEYLVKKNASSLFNIRDKNHGATPLMLAAKNVKMDESILELRSSNVNFTLVDKDGKNFMAYLLQGKKNPELLSGLIDDRKAFKYADLGNAIDARDTTAVKKFVALGANVNNIINKRTFETPLHLAAKSSDKEFAIKTLKFFIESGADIASRDVENYTFLHRLVDDGTTLSPSQLDEIAKFLVDRNGSQLFNSQGVEGSTPFQLAVKNVEVENATLLLLKKNGVNFNALDNDKDSPLFYAVAGSRNTTLLSNLVTFEADPRHVNIKNETLLHFSTLYGKCNSTDQLELFLKLDLDINAVDRYGRTPLHTVLWNRRCPNVSDNIQFLIKEGADTNKRDIYGDSPLDDVLKKSKCRVNDKDQVAKLLDNKVKQRYN